MKTNTRSEYPEEVELLCRKCNKQIYHCDICGNPDDFLTYFNEEDILCYKGKHYCEECAEKITKRTGAKDEN